MIFENDIQTCTYVTGDEFVVHDFTVRHILINSPVLHTYIGTSRIAYSSPHSKKVIFAKLNEIAKGVLKITHPLHFNYCFVVDAKQRNMTDQSVYVKCT